MLRGFLLAIYSIIATNWRGDIFIWLGQKYSLQNMSENFDLNQDVTIQNIVGSGKLPVEIDTEMLGEGLNDHAKGDSYTWMDDGPQPGLYYEIDGDEGPQVTFHESGSYIVRADNEEELHSTNELVISQLKEMGAVKEDVEMEVLDFQVQNVVALAMLNEDIKLRALSMALQGQKGDAQYEPEVFPALEYSNDDYPCSFLVYGNGKVIIAGASSVDEVYDSMRDFYTRIEKVYFDATRR